ncbi:MAG: CopG family transcriptional regulator [Selenomonadaceae bacterium]|nr:CopG family transcriptional regulator [Selenomonadaceae bacterium]
METLKFEGKDFSLIQDYVSARNMNLRDFMLQAALEKIEDERDISVYKEKMAEFENDPVYYTIDEVREMIK